MTLRSRPLKRSSHPREVRVARKREQVLSTHQTSFNTTSKATPKLTPHRILSRARRLWRLLVLASTPICPSRCRPQLWVNLTHRLKTLSSRGSQSQSYRSQRTRFKDSSRRRQRYKLCSRSMRISWIESPGRLKISKIEKNWKWRSCRLGRTSRCRNLPRRSQEQRQRSLNQRQSDRSQQSSGRHWRDRNCRRKKNTSTR